MKIPLCSAIALAIFAMGATGSPASTHASALATQKSADARQALGGIRYARMSELADALAASGDDPSYWLDSQTRGAAVGDRDPVVAWIPAALLGNAEARAAAADLIRDGMAVLVTGTDDEPRHDAKTFGIHVPGKAVLYQSLPDGTLDVHSTGTTNKLDRSAWTRLTEHATQTRNAATTHHRPHDDQPSVPVGPFRRYSTWTISPANKGAAVGMEIVVSRDSSNGSDKKFVTVKAQARAIPFRNGLTSDGWPQTGIDKEYPFSFHGMSKLLYLVDNYKLFTRVSWPSGQNPNVAAVKQYPQSTASTDMKFTNAQEKTTTFGWSAGVEAGASLSAKGIEPAGKASVKYNNSTKSTTTHAMSMTVQDYSTAVSMYSASNYKQVRWQYDLSSTISSNGKYFNAPKNSGYVEVTRATPMMRMADLQGYSEWSVDGHYEGALTIASVAEIYDRVWRNQNNTSYVYKDWPQKAFADLVKPDPEFLYSHQPISRITLDLGVPQLSRYPTVLLQSMGADNGCLTQANPSQPTITLATCNTSDSNKAQQWELDQLDRYVNRGSKMCLAMAGGKAAMQACSTAQSQKWVWRADRIHMVNQLASRMYANGSTVDIRNGQNIPVNAANELLPPWGSYPKATFMGDLIPGFAFATKVDNPEYLTFDEVSPNERWITIPVVSGLY